jgi:hypothetical protein
MDMRLRWSCFEALQGVTVSMAVPNILQRHRWLLSAVALDLCALPEMPNSISM